MAQQLWAGIDAGKLAHHCVVVDADGKRVFSRRAANDEATLGELITEVSALADVGGLTWAIDLAGGWRRAVDHAAVGRRPAAAVHPRAQRA